MTQRTKMDFPLNTPTEIELLYDEPVIGENQYGPYYLYAIRSNGEEYSLFAPESVHEELSQLRRGEKAVITKIAAQRGSKVVVTYDVQMPERPLPPGDSKPSAENGSPIKDELYKLMLWSYRDALKIQSELNGLADPSKIAITLFIARSRSGNLNYGG